MTGSAEEIFDIVDEEDRVVGQAPRSRCHGNPALIHRAVHVLVLDRSGRLLLQRRSPRKDIQPGRWDTSVGGHLEPGEGYREAAIREMEEELGLCDLPLTFLYRSRIRNAIESENIATFLTCFEGAVDFNPAEIDEVRAWASEEIEAALGSGVFTPNFEQEWGMFRDWNRRYPARGGEGVAFCAGETFPDLFGGLGRDKE